MSLELSKSTNRRIAAEGIESQMVRSSDNSQQYKSDSARILNGEMPTGPNFAADFTQKILAGITLLRIPTSMGKSFNVTKFIDDQFKTPSHEKRGKSAFLMPTRTNVVNAHTESKEKDRNFGYSIGGERVAQEDESGTYFTYGKFQNLLIANPLLRGYDRIVLDEADVLKYGEEFYIPYLIFLAQARPEMEIIMMSATIDIPYFQKQFKVDKGHIFEMEQTSRPRPIDIQYNTQPVSDDSKVMQYKQYAPKLLNKIDHHFVTGEDELIPKGSAMLCFLPTYNAIDKIEAELLKDPKYKEVEIRTLKGNMTSEEIEAVVSTPAPENVRVIILSTDVANRAVNWSDALNIDTVYDCGIRNTETFNPNTQRNTVQMQFATAQQLEQSMGRAGRNFESDAKVRGYIGIPEAKVRKAITDDNFALDPSFMILECAKLFKKINTSDNTLLEDLPTEFKPKDFAGFVNEAVQNEAMTTSSIARLTGMGALDLDLNVTKFGEFLIDVRMFPQHCLKTISSILIWYKSFTSCKLQTTIKTGRIFF